MGRELAIRVWETKLESQSVKVYLIPAREDNLIYLVSWGEQALVVDPCEAEAVSELLASDKIELKAILNTHHHDDHIAGNMELKKEADCNVVGPSETQIESVDQVVSDGEEIIIGPLMIQVISTPGHTLDHICYYCSDYKMLFAGDAIFAAGIGRVFEGTIQTMYESLQKIAALPDDTYIFCGHDYTLANLQFASELEPNNEYIKARIERIKSGDEQALPTSLENERKTNPFLRLNSEEIRDHLGMKEASDVEVFGKLRELKDHYKSSVQESPKL